jgi:hypothetical protein
VLFRPFDCQDPENPRSTRCVGLAPKGFSVTGIVHGAHDLISALKNRGGLSGAELRNIVPIGVIRGDRRSF